MNVQWWCSARGAPWDGSWQAYPGVWLFVIAVGALFWNLRPSHASPGNARPAPRTFNRLAFPLSLFLLWLTLDWPMGPLGAGYLAWIHSAQFLMIAMVVPPLLLLGLDRDRIASLLSRHAVFGSAVRRMTHPLFAIILFAVTMVLTHLPNIVDSLMASQLGAFALDLTWLVVGLIFWWPVIVRVPERIHFPALVQMLYLFFGTQPHLYIAMWLLAADYPAYGTYELAPRITSLSAITDQQIAGALMLGFGATYVLGAISVLFFRWMARETA
jgi:cytochrome c oxidase assembly factor CtaG